MKATTLLISLAVGMAASSFAQDQGGPPPGGPPRGGPGFGGPGGPGGMDRGLQPIDRLVFRRDVQEDIKLSDEQRTKLDVLRPRRGPGGQGGPGGPPGGGPGGQGDQGGPPPPPPGGQGGPPPGGPGGPGGDRTAMEAQHKKLEEAIKAILTADQAARVKEIAIQLAGGRAVLDKNVQAELGLSADQKSQIGNLVKAQQAASRSLFEKAQNGDLDREQVQDAMQRNGKNFESKLSSVLTGDQTAKLQAMAGQKFNATEQDRFGGPPPPPPGGGAE